ncbi:NADH:ubiquinone oxidoreductase [Apiotrichum porosum]|uniref:NADH:ubiquinone oxidoreductase n=1 Tax=Apiotrichum porosum TaxID=105984 RepID=A0A427XQ48_9TREE|nr:NADH:ubiquinone oxidoreductase [Apiotrichum porosum]RSH80955.1 NADH:ubiquinone oxidoreductase [Apiotrichum porosum]
MSAGPALEASSSIDNGHAGLHKVSSSITMGSHDENQEFASPREEADYYRDKYNEVFNGLTELQEELDSFTASSKELENELEDELQHTEAREQDLKGRLAVAEGERDDWKTKYLDLQKRHNLEMDRQQGTIDNLTAEGIKARAAYRDLENGNDQLERNERVATSSLLDLESKYNRVIEEKTVLEQEIVQKQEVEEECQRLKDDVRDANNEIAILRDQLARMVVPTPPSSTAPMSPVPERVSHSRTGSRSDAASPTPTDRSATTERSVRSAAGERSDRSTTVTPSNVRPRGQVPGSPRVPSRSALPPLSPSAKRSNVSSPSSIPALSRSTTTRNLTQPTVSSARRAAGYNPSPTTRASQHQMTKNKASKLLHDLQARIKTTDDKIGKMVKKAPAQLARRQPTTSNASTTSAAAASATAASSLSASTIGRPRAATTLAMTMATPRPASHAEDSDVGFLSPTSWVLLSEPEDTPIAAQLARPAHNREEPPSPSRTATQRSRGLPTRPSIPSPLVRETKARAGLSQSVRGERPPPLSSSIARPPSRTHTHVRTVSRSGAMSPSITAHVRRTSVSTNGDFSSPPASASTFRSSSSRPSSRNSSRADERPTARGAFIGAVGAGPLRTNRPSHKSHGSHSGTMMGNTTPNKALTTAARRPARRSSMGVVETGQPPTGIPAPRTSVSSSIARPTSLHTPPPPVPRIPSQVLRESKSRQESQRPRSPPCTLPL